MAGVTLRQLHAGLLRSRVKLKAESKNKNEAGRKTLEKNIQIKDFSLPSLLNRAISPPSCCFRLRGTHTVKTPLFPDDARPMAISRLPHR
jgi:hypothetical protein